MLLRPGDILEGALETYTIAAVISRGAYGCAFRARTSDGSWRVIKQFEPSEELPVADIAYQRRCFEREAEILTRFRLPLMVQGYELVQRDDEVFLVMEHVEGETLRVVFDRHQLDTGHPFCETTVVTLGLQLCAVIDSLHHLSGQVIYRDLKPSNIMWDAVAKRIKLIDFGTARFNAGTQQATQGLGTEGYAPPELYGSRHALGPATDVYTIGAVLYELACGQPPARRATPTDFRGYDDLLSRGFCQAVLQALQQDPADRPPTAAALGELLRSGAAAPAEALRLPLTALNQHPLLACSCPVCGRAPASEHSIHCGLDGAMYQVAMLQILPRHRPARAVYLEQDRAVIGRNDPDTGYYPEIDLSAADPARHVGRRHAVLERTGVGEWSLEVGETVNPTRLDGRLVEPGSRHTIGPGARLELADLVAVLRLRPVLDEPPAEVGS